MNNSTSNRDFAARARTMTEDALRFSRQDCLEAAAAAEALERAGCCGGKTGGDYRDEGVAYGAELRRRGLVSN